MVDRKLIEKAENRKAEIFSWEPKYDYEKEFPPAVIAAGKKESIEKIDQQILKYEETGDYGWIVSVIEVGAGTSIYYSPAVSEARREKEEKRKRREEMARPAPSRPKTAAQLAEELEKRREEERTRPVRAAIEKYGQVFRVLTFGSPNPKIAKMAYENWVEKGLAVPWDGPWSFLSSRVAEIFRESITGTGTASNSAIATCWTVGGVESADISAAHGEGWVRGIDLSRAKPQK